MLPSVSVVLPAYNHGGHLAGAIQAILRQSVVPLELLVIDDGSTDDSLQVASDFARRHSFVRVLENDRNRGVVYSINRGVDSAQGEFVYLASADDRVLPGFLEKSLRLLGEHPKAGVSMTDFAFMDSGTGALSPKHLAIAPISGYLLPDELASRLRGLGDVIPGCTTIFRREALQQLGGFSEELRWHCDWFATLALAFRYGLCYIAEPLAAYRFGPGGYSDGARRDRNAQRRVLVHLLGALGSEEFKDVAPLFHRSRALSKFGLPIVRACLEDPRYRPALRQLPHLGILLREARSLLIRLGPVRLRRAYWRARYRLQRRPHA
ncbi:MAG: glycosyltransferase family A protein [Myxococcota bacterium]